MEITIDVEPIEGMNLICVERLEQIYKHGCSAEDDDKYEKDELIAMAQMALTGDATLWPFENGGFEWRDKILKKSRIGRLMVAGALITAALDCELRKEWNQWTKSF